MTKDFFDDLYYCRYRPYERKVRRGPKYEEIETKIQAERDYFSSIMSPKDYERFLEMEDLYERSGEHDDIDAFAYGLRFGAMFMNAILAD